MDWATSSADWPFSEHSVFLDVPPHRWHVQRFGTGPSLVLLHGAGGATQSFRNLAPLLAKHFEIVMMDFPGQGFTKLGTRQRSGLQDTTRDIGAVLEALEVEPDLIVAHSAGAAVALALAQTRADAAVVGINPALGPFEGVAGWLFPFVAKLLALNPFVPGIFARLSRSAGRVEGLLASTGSRLDPVGTALYRRLIEDRDHVDGTLLMMASWSVTALLDQLPQIGVPVLFLLGANDGAVPNKVGLDAAQKLPKADVEIFPGQGHLVHETAPEPVAQAILAFAKQNGFLQSSSA
ncbi:MAG: alpha/beta fold hydrolase BchO [Pseudomonadota bacterium]